MICLYVKINSLLWLLVLALVVVVVFDFQLYFQFLTILQGVFTEDLGWGKVMIICIYVYCCLFWVIFLSHIDSILLIKELCNFLYFIWAETDNYLVNIFISPFTDHKQGSHSCWHNGSFKVPYFSKFYFQVFVFTYFIVFFDWYIIISKHWYII